MIWSKLSWSGPPFSSLFTRRLRDSQYTLSRISDGSVTGFSVFGAKLH
jgi:hypothetical protein